MTDNQKCSRCKCIKLLSFYKIRGNTGKYYKTCLLCCERIKCSLCDYKCNANSHLKRHIKVVHTQIKDVECSLCDFKCSANGDLKQHTLYHCSRNNNMSGLEYKTNNILIKLGYTEGKDYIYNSTYSKLTDYCGRLLRPDFRFHDHKIMIEADGIQHEKATSFSGYDADENFKKIQESDSMKNEFCKKYNYKMIRIRYDEKDIEKLLREELKEII